MVGAIIGLVISLAITVFYVYCGWKIFTKANEPGWAAIVPIYNIVVMLKIVGKPIWWLVLFLIPGVSAIAGILIAISLAKSFGKSTGFGIGLVLLGPIFGPMLAFSDATYQGPAG
jgi:hypothetical protein